ncbi:hypothetical protein Sste5346_007350 [Sporothrix stenoceras]|uniref:PPM-type phosphatase domain-containing protein n=1 Tax=Sporothrix stenoceras TaxID=5173 RepID=A0ABR3YUK0_9PEZI
MASLRATRFAAAFRQAARPTTTTFTTSSRRFVATKAQLRASANWITYATVAGAATVPAALWILSDTESSKALSTPDLEKDAGHVGTLRGPSPKEVTDILNAGAYTVPVNFAVRDITRYDGMQLASNSQCEDYFTHGTIAAPGTNGKGSGQDGRWAAWGVFDGHAGWQTAELLSRTLVPSVRDSLNAAAAASPRLILKNEAVVQQAITRAFVDLDNSIINTAAEIAQLPDGSIHSSWALSFADKINTMMPAWAGSCALLSLYDPSTRNLHVACTGDSRAVLGRERESYKGGEQSIWEAVPLSVDQAGTNPDEVARLNAEHPGEEETLVRGGRVLGIMVSRAFGDCRWKWPTELQESLFKRYGGAGPLQAPRYQVKTPPYLTAEPVVTTTQLEENRPAFMIIASDGLWDRLSSQEAVDLVGKWLASSGSDFGGKDGKGATTPSKRPARLGRDFDPIHYTTIQDGNAAVHLARNALGGRDEATLAARLAYGPPFSRNIRDDITVQVVFFNMDKENLPKA